jgi:ATP-binding cassette, subfamily C (CFTR/MRP), member 4
MNHEKQRQKVKNPYDEANRLSKMSFWWLRSLYKIGLTRTITEDDIYETLKDHESEKIATKFTRLWSDELKKKNPSVLRVFYRAFGIELLTTALTLSILETSFRVIQPLFIGALLTNFVDSETAKRDAYFYATAIVICSLIPALSFHRFVNHIFIIGTKIRIGSSRLVYDKVTQPSTIERNDEMILLQILRFSKSSYSDNLSGKAISLLSNDLGKFHEALLSMHVLWQGPMELAVFGYLTYREMGVSGVVGIIFILSFVPIQCELNENCSNFDCFMTFPLQPSSARCRHHSGAKPPSELTFESNS